MKVITVIGARPQFIKAAVVSRAFAEHRSDVKEIIVHTGQHYDVNMSDVFFDELNIPRPDYNLGIGGGTHGQNTGRMVEKLEELMLKLKPDGVLVYGDTDSTLAGALSAAKLHIPVVHVEAGLRSFNRKMPEEINRVVADHLSSLLFAPTETACINLCNEGISEDKIHLVGDVMYDAALYYRARARKPQWFDSFGLASNEWVLCTIHRAENTDCPERMHGIFAGLAECGLPVILPIHPRTKNKLLQINILIPENIRVVKPVGYLEMVWLEANCKVVATDSGGVQKEAYFHGKPCVTLRDETEWLELVDSGYNSVVGTDQSKITTSILKDNTLRFNDHLYGDGKSSLKITEIISYL